MHCPLCDHPLQLKRRSLAEPDRNMYFCTGCPMAYMLLRHHEEESIRQTREVFAVFGGRPAFR
jgi:hypothetical protein